MKKSLPFSTSSETQLLHDGTPENDSQKHCVARRSFLRGLGMAGATLLPASALLITKGKAQETTSTGELTKGDVAILKFWAAAELLETDLWEQYRELGRGNQPYKEALEVIDSDMVQYVADNADDERSHAAFINAYLASHGEEPVNLDPFRTLPSSQATGAEPIGRLTNLKQLTVDTSWYTRYRGEENPDFGATFPQAVLIMNRPAIPVTNSDLKPQNHIQAIANTAAFHFGTIEQGGSSLYASLIPKVTSLEVLRTSMPSPLKNSSRPT